MPTKPNHSGQQQEYVPAGNGDASGEYADNATGSNVHFKSFKKPENDTSKGAQSKTKLPKDKKDKKETKETKDQPQKPHIQDAEKKIKSILSNDMEITLDGFDEETCGVLQDTLGKVVGDFPALKNNLISIGSVSGLNKLQEKDFQERYDKFIKSITPEKIENKRQKLIEWNPNTDKSRWTDEYVKDIIMQTEQPYRNKRVSLPRAAEGACNTYSGRTISMLVFKDSVGKKKHKDAINHEYDTGWWSSNNANQTFAHELGHAVETLLRKDINYTAEIEKLYNNATADELSGYSRKNAREFVAESFAAYYGGMNNPVADEVVEFVKNQYGRQYK